MVTVESSMHVPGMRARGVIGFMQNPSDELYRDWWPGTHFRMHPLNECAGVGQVVCMDEMVGDRRINVACEVVEFGPNHITWRFKRLIKLPCWLEIRIDDDDSGATITHTIRAGYSGLLGRLLDVLFRLYFSARFARMMDDHVRFEFSALPGVLARHQTEASA